MSTGTTTGYAECYSDILSFDNDPALRERDKKIVEFLAFYSHLDVLGRSQGVSPDLVLGTTMISVPAYFALPGHGTNPVNQAALDLLPEFSYTTGYGNSTYKNVRETGLKEAMSLPDDPLKAARKSRAVQHIVAHALGLNDPASHLAYATKDSFGDPLRELASGVTRDLDERAVGEVSAVASTAGANLDFLDYLVDVRAIIDERVELIFSTEAQVE